MTKFELLHQWLKDDHPDLAPQFEAQRDARAPGLEVTVESAINSMAADPFDAVYDFVVFGEYAYHVLNDLLNLTWADLQPKGAPFDETLKEH